MEWDIEFFHLYLKVSTSFYKWKIIVLPCRPCHEISMDLQSAQLKPLTLIYPGDTEMHHGKCMHFCGPKIAACMDTACGETWVSVGGRYFVGGALKWDPPKCEMKDAQFLLLTLARGKV